MRSAGPIRDDGGGSGHRPRHGHPGSDRGQRSRPLSVLQLLHSPEPQHLRPFPAAHGKQILFTLFFFLCFFIFLIFNRSQSEIWVGNDEYPQTFFFISSSSLVVAEERVHDRVRRHLLHVHPVRRRPVLRSEGTRWAPTPSQQLSLSHISWLANRKPRMWPDSVGWLTRENKGSASCGFKLKALWGVKSLTRRVYPANDELWRRLDEGKNAWRIRERVISDVGIRFN